MKNKQPTVNISQELFKALISHFLMDSDNSDFITKQLNIKLNKMIEHDLYTKFKTAATEREREQARIDYLDRIGIPDQFRY